MPHQRLHARCVADQLADDWSGIYRRRTLPVFYDLPVLTLEGRRFYRLKPLLLGEARSSHEQDVAPRGAGAGFPAAPPSGGEGEPARWPHDQGEPVTLKESR